MHDLILYDRSPNHNDLVKSTKALWLPNGGNEANAADAKIMVIGHVARGIYVNNPTANVGYRNNATKGRAKNDEPEAMYMVVDATRFSTIWLNTQPGSGCTTETRKAALPGTATMEPWRASCLGTGGRRRNYGHVGKFDEGSDHESATRPTPPAC